MATVETSKAINLYQLGLEVDAPMRTLRRGDNWTISADIDQGALEAAVEAHVADPSIAPPPPPPPLVKPEDRLDEDTTAATLALLTEDSVGYRALLSVIVQALNIPEATVAAVQAAATERLVTLADRPEVRRQMMADRIARAEAARRG